jgi:hypothetical protein
MRQFGLRVMCGRNYISSMVQSEVRPKSFHTLPQIQHHRNLSSFFWRWNVRTDRQINSNNLSFMLCMQRLLKAVFLDHWVPDGRWVGCEVGIPGSIPPCFAMFFCVVPRINWIRLFTLASNTTIRFYIIIIKLL